MARGHIEDEISPNPLLGVSQGTDVRRAAKRMANRNIGALGVYSEDGNHLVGIITERDVTRAVAHGPDLDRIPVAEFMNPAPLTHRGPISRSEARRMMQLEGVRHLIIDRAGSHGILSLRDVVETDS